jgi:acyl-coenzyme A synthetase/AMP-(fatty) acid ligase/aryl carrier-like protein
MKIAPTHLAALVAAAASPQAIMPRMRLVLGGEALPWGVARVFQSFAPGCRLFNHYGPTETTIGAVAAEIDVHTVDPLSVTVPIGRSMAQARVYVLDPFGEPAPVGIAGEIYIGGDTVARGYLHREDLTAERFSPDPASSAPGARRYRTGDRARYLPDGSIEFLGRLDRQVKMNGYRIELEEIEVALRKHPALRESAVRIAGEAHYQRIDAYVVGAAGANPACEDIRGFLKERLPDYMIPARILVIPRMPVTANGKIDYTALPSPDHMPIERTGEQIAPHTETQRRVAAVFRELIGVAGIGVDDDFFEIGGHSLLAMRLLSRTREAFQIDISLRSIFESPTIAGISAIVDAALGEQQLTS